MWAGGFAFFLSFYLLLSSLPIYVSEAGIPPEAMGLIIGCFAFASMLVRPWAGWAADRYGRKPLLLGGSLIFVGCSLAYGASSSVAALLGIRLLHGCGMGLFPTAASAVVADVSPPGRRGELMGLWGIAFSVPMAIGPIAGVEVARRLGFIPFFGLTAAVAAVALLLSVAVPETAPRRPMPGFRLATALSRAAVFPSLIVLCAMFTYGAQVSFLPIYALDQGVNSGLFFLVFAFVLAATRGPAGRLSDRVGRVPVAAGGLIVAALSLAVLAAMRDLASLMISGALYGVAIGATQPALTAWVVDVVEPEDRGRALGTYYTALELGIATGAIATGVGVSRVGFGATYLGLAGVALAGAALALTRFLPRRRRRW